MYLRTPWPFFLVLLATLAAAALILVVKVILDIDTNLNNTLQFEGYHNFSSKFKFRRLLLKLFVRVHGKGSALRNLSIELRGPETSSQAHLKTRFLRALSSVPRRVNDTLRQ
jgi:hypothetical protein